jgi:hypothetical protein
MTFGKTVAFAGVLLALSAASAAAAPALAVNNVNLRQGPGTTYTVIMTIPGGSNVDVGGCSGQWCRVTFQGQNGYAIATSFDQGGGAPPPGAAGPLHLRAMQGRRRDHHPRAMRPPRRPVMPVRLLAPIPTCLYPFTRERRRPSGRPSMSGRRRRLITITATVPITGRIGAAITGAGRAGAHRHRLIGNPAG